MVMGVVRRKDGTKLVKGLYRLKMGVMQLRRLELLFDREGERPLNKMILKKGKRRDRGMDGKGMML